ncbi:MAG: UPF0149 family protein [Betaproteobacteria bacterium]
MTLLPLSSAEVDELDAMFQSLDQESNPMDLSMADGFLTGVLVHPRTILPSDWLPRLIDPRADTLDLSNSAIDATRFIELIMRRYNELAACIAAREPFAPIVPMIDDDEDSADDTSDGLPEVGGAQPGGGARELAARADDHEAIEPAVRGQTRAETAAAPRAGAVDDAANDDDALDEALPLNTLVLAFWCAGFFNAINAWPGLGDLPADEVAPLLANLYRYIPAGDNDELRQLHRDLDAALPRPDSAEDAIDDLVATVLDLADITRPNRPVRRAPKLGRNEPCWCGSGRKYKRCHGAG